MLALELAVVAFLIVLPSLGRPTGDMVTELGIAVLKAALALAVILFAGQRPMRVWFHVVARQRSPELFMLNVLLVTIGLAAATEFAGLSLALGAFLAGMLIAETEYRYQVEEDIKPFRDVLLGLFFVTVGMALDLHVVADQWLLVLGLLVGPVIAKLLLIFVLSRLFGAPVGTSLRTAFYLSQAGEFALVMLTVSLGEGLLAPQVAQPILAAMVLSMLLAPIVIQFADPVVRRLSANDWLARAAQLTDIAARTMARQDHVVVCGYGRSGQNLARQLEQEDIAFLCIDADPQRVREATGSSGNVVYGDATRRETLIAAGVGKARALAITFADTRSALKILHHVRAMRPELPVIVRTLDDSELDKLLAAGATEVVPEVLEGSLMLASHSMLLMGVPLNRVLTRIRTIREQRYGLFRGFFHGITDAGDSSEQARLHSVPLPARAFAVGRTLADLPLAGLVEVTGVRRRGARSMPPGDAGVLEPGDVVVLLGRPANLMLAEDRLLRGAGA